MWEGQQSALSSRLRTGIVINLQQKFLLLFFYYTQQLIRRQITYTIKLYEALKVNPVICEQFAVKKRDEEVFELNDLNSKSVSIYRDTSKTSNNKS